MLNMHNCLTRQAQLVLEKACIPSMQLVCAYCPCGILTGNGTCFLLLQLPVQTCPQHEPVKHLLNGFNCLPTHLPRLAATFLLSAVLGRSGAGEGGATSVRGATGGTRATIGSVDSIAAAAATAARAQPDHRPVRPLL